MKVAIVFFSYRDDAVLLGYALQAVRRLRERGYEVDAFVRDDAAAPLVEVPAGCDYKLTSFKRCRNLNGCECVAGMLSEYAAIVDGGGYDWVVKADCDTYINDLEWLRVGDGVIHVGTSHVDGYCSGSCYALSRDGVARLVDYMADEVVRKRVQRAWCEDKAISRMSIICGQAMVKENSVNALREGYLYHDWYDKSAGFAELRQAAAVDFKRCMWNSTPGAYDVDRDSALERMAGYVDFLLNN